MTTPPGLRAAKKLETWRSLRAAAVELVSARGFDAVSVEEIAAAANVSKSTLFNYFDSKESLLLDPDPEDSERWQALADARPHDEPMWESLLEIVIGSAGRDGSKLLLRKSVIEQCPTLFQSAWASSEPFRCFVRGWVTQRLAPDNDAFRVALVVNTAFAVVHAAYRSWEPQEGPDRFTALVRDGFAAVGDGFLQLGGPPAPGTGKS
ncbi:TetR family transcriptional regulator [Rhodococcus spelaei]|uniref:TetR family transcriptional regulator n=1 Tax=Rhodococcus spelaei TaxID=2546320 RepID=A0A541B9U4_9NOCA|nr:TetR/AcrR family transcriptional regulator [Rhodococcus spelaei]TQF69094.1 TetR family transcriptional regulator [Rhodococcus spelaei]